MGKPLPTPQDRIRALRAEYEAAARSVPDPLDAPTLREAQAARQLAARIHGVFAAAASAIDTAAHRTAKYEAIAVRLRDRRAEIDVLDADRAAAVIALMTERHPATVTHWERQIDTLERMIAERRAQSVHLDTLATERHTEATAAEHRAAEAVAAWRALVAEREAAA